MNDETSINSDQEARAHQALTASIRFKQNMVHGIGAATVFGFATGAFGALIKLGMVGLGAAETAGVATALTLTSGLAWVGIAALVAVGVGCLYLSSKYTSQLVNLEQSRHAKQIAQGINGAAPVVEHKPTMFPSQQAAAAADVAKTETPAPNAPHLQAASTVTDERTLLAEKVVPITALATSRGAA